MKKIIVSIGVVWICMHGVTTSTVFARCDPSYFSEPYCVITGLTVTQETACDVSSDTSGRHLPTVVEAPCREVPEVPLDQQEKIYKLLKPLFPHIYEQYLYDNDDYIVDTSTNSYSAYRLMITDNMWKEIEQRQKMGDLLFEYLQHALEREYNKGIENADLEKIAAYQFTASLIGYDYQFKEMAFPINE